MSSSATQRPFVTARLPWLLGGTAFLVYLATLNHWLSLNSLGNVARASGWLWRPQLEQPLTFAVLLPFRLLPEPSVPIALNLFTAVCAALVIVLLTRSVALLPHDLAPASPLPQAQHPGILTIRIAWVAPVLAAIGCGLQLTFWEHATSATGEMINLLLIAYVVRCLLEFRLDQKQSWLARAACLYGAGMANNWALVALFPVFVFTLARLKGLGPFFQRAFLLKLSLWLLIGLSLYLLLPSVQGLGSHRSVDFWTTLKAHLKSQKEIVGYFHRPASRALTVAALLPLLLLSIRWRSHSMQFNDDTRFGVFLSKATGHSLHGFFLFSSLWLMLDPTFSPRHLGLGLPMLTYYFFTALVLGYSAGYFLLFALPHNGPYSPDTPLWWQRLRTLLAPRAPALVGSSGIALVCALAFLLLGRNTGQILQTNGPRLRQFAADLYNDLPSGNSVVLSDDPTELLLLQADLSARRKRNAVLPVDAPSLTSPLYHAFMQRRFGARWSTNLVSSRSQPLGPGRLLNLIADWAVQQPLFYLHPAFGPLFELFSGEARGCIFALTPQFTNALGSAAELPLTASSAAQLDTNEQLWQRRWSNHLQDLTAQTKEHPQFPPGPAHTLRKILRLAAERNGTAVFLGAMYSKRLNDWGAALQDNGRISQAIPWFTRALELNPDNLSAHVNLQYAERCQRGDKARLTMVAVQTQFPQLFAQFDTWRDVLMANGRMAEPTFLFRTGRMLLAGGNLRQASRAFSRSAELAPEWTPPRLWLSQTRLQLRDFAGALAQLDSIPASRVPEDGPGLAHVLDCRASALRGLGRTNEAAACIESCLAQHDKFGEVLLTAAELYSRNREFDRALPLLEELLKREPNRPELLSKRGLVELQLSRYDSAIATFTSVLEKTPGDEDALLCRAVALLMANQLEASRADYQELLKGSANSRNALFGLGTIAWRQHQTNSALQFYEQYLASKPPPSPQYAIAADRIKELHGEKK